MNRIKWFRKNIWRFRCLFGCEGPPCAKTHNIWHFRRVLGVRVHLVLSTKRFGYAGVLGPPMASSKP